MVGHHRPRFRAWNTKHAQTSQTPKTLVTARRYNPVVDTGSHWKDLPTGAGMGGGGRGSGNGPPGMAQGGGGRLKPDAGPVWGHPGRNGGGSWDDVGPGGGAGGGGGWDDTVGPWAKQKMGGGGGGPLWGDSEIDWAHKQGKQQLTKEMIWNSKQFRMLAELGHKVTYLYITCFVY